MAPLDKQLEENKQLEEIVKFSIPRSFFKVFLNHENAESVRKIVFDHNGQTVLISETGTETLIMGKLEADYHEKDVYSIYQPNLFGSARKRVLFYSNLREMYSGMFANYDISLKVDSKQASNQAQKSP